MVRPNKKATIIILWIILIPSVAANTNGNKVTITHIKSDNQYYNVSAVCIEGNNTRVYIDLFDIPQEYADKPADAIFITHSHLAHYDPTSIDLVAQNTTTYIGPNSCNEFISKYNGTGVVPGDNGTVAGIQFEAFRAYNTAHPYQDNLCGYIITVNGIRIFHSGDTGNIPEFQGLEGRIDVLILAVGSSYATMTFDDAIDAIGVIKTKYLIPVHYLTMSIYNFIKECTETYPDLKICTEGLVLTPDDETTEEGVSGYVMIVSVCAIAMLIIYYKKKGHFWY